MPGGREIVMVWVVLMGITYYDLIILHIHYGASA